MADIPVRKSRIVLFGLTLAVILAIIATVLLANDRRHLKSLLAHYGLLEPSPPPAPVLEKQSRRTDGGAASPSGNLAERLFSGSGMTPFARVIRFPAPDMCRLFSERGFEGDGWQPSPIGGVAECTAEKIVTAGPEAPPASLFAVVRGTESDDINSLRIKIVAPPGDGGESARKELDAVLASLIDETGWSDLTPLRERIAAREEVDMTDYSLSITFKREFTNPDAYNLIIRPASTNPDVRKLEKPPRPGPFNQ